MCIREGEIDVVEIDGTIFVELETILDLFRLAGERQRVHGNHYAAGVIAELVGVCEVDLGMVATT